MITRLICRLFGHRWVDVIPGSECPSQAVIGMCYRCDELRCKTVEETFDTDKLKARLLGMALAFGTGILFAAALMAGYR